MAAPEARSTRGNGHLNPREMTELRRFERCSVEELTRFSQPTLARYRDLMLQYSASAASQARPLSAA
jgi:hypothetical protein